MIPPQAFIPHRIFSAVVHSLMLGAAQVGATEMVYAPVNPSFGGNPNNAPGLMSIAQAQNQFKAPVVSPLEAFNLSLQRAILSRLSSQAIATMFGSNGGLKDGDYDTAGYLINVHDDHDGTLHITTTDKATGAISAFVISSNERPVDPILP